MPVEPPSILSKAFELLRAFNTHDRVMTLSELARAADLPKSTVHRLLARLVELDAIEPHGHGYKLSLGLLEFGAVTPAASMREAAMPYLTALHRFTGQTVHLAVLRGFDVVYLEKLTAPQTTPALSRIGGKLPANCTAVGKALLAWQDLDRLADTLPDPLPRLTTASIGDVHRLLGQLREIRHTRVAHEHDEAASGLSCVAAPIVANDIAVGAVSVGYRSGGRLDPRVVTALTESAGQIATASSRILGDERRSAWFPVAAHDTGDGRRDQR